MNDHFIKNIEIKNFKCFENFSAEGFGRVNLIGGKNNVGKTAFMEACCTNIYTKNIDTLYTTLMYVTYVREKLEYINKLFSLKDDIVFFENIKNYSVKTNINNIQYKLIDQDGRKKEYKFNINKDESIISVDDFPYRRELTTSILFVDGKGFTNKHLKKIYIEVQRRDKEELLNKYLNSFDSSIEKFKIFNDSPECKTKDKKDYLRLSEFGDGLRNYISIISALYACSDSYVFIDEIENGIHYTNLDKLWEIILTISKQQNVQLFATTHSKECIESYARVAKRLKDEEIAMITMARNPKNKLKALVWNQKQFLSELEQNHEVRGW
ncbi:MAG: AAA family ATPase [Campylobacterota bacterium]|nr:AAA family ATPase [Campylobacterota bacterium]